MPYKKDKCIKHGFYLCTHFVMAILNPKEMSLDDNEATFLCPILKRRFWVYRRRILLCHFISGTSVWLIKDIYVN
jgi:hypothetical protein